MKSKEFAKKYLESNSKPNCLYEIIIQMNNDLGDILKTRKSISYVSIAGTIEEANKKYIKFVSLVNPKSNKDSKLKYTGFMIILKKLSPGLFIIHEQYLCLKL